MSGTLTIKLKKKLYWVSFQTAGVVCQYTVKVNIFIYLYKKDQHNAEIISHISLINMSYNLCNYFTKQNQ